MSGLAVFAPRHEMRFTQKPVCAKDVASLPLVASGPGRTVIGVARSCLGNGLMGMSWVGVKGKASKQI